MSPEQLKDLRQELSCTAKELAATLELDQATVLAWEKGALFPTKKYIDRMEALRERGPGAIVRRAKGDNPLKGLADPIVWELFRKIAAHKKLREAVIKLAAAYSDPAE